MKAKLFITFLTAALCLSMQAQNYANQTEVMAWGNLSGIRLEGELIDFETSLQVGYHHSGKERYQTSYERIDGIQQVKTNIENVNILLQVKDAAPGKNNMHLEMTSAETLNESAGLCIHLDAEKYAPATIKASGNKISVLLKEKNEVLRNLTFSLSKPAKTKVIRGKDDIQIFIPIASRLQKDVKCVMDIRTDVSGKIDHSTATVQIDRLNPGRAFLGLGGNFRLQNPNTDPQVIDYCLENLRVAYGRVEMPWRQWQPEEDKSLKDYEPKDLPEHVRKSMEMAQKLQKKGMPIIVSCWFPPEWAIKGSSSKYNKKGGVVAYKLEDSKQAKINASLADYLVYLKKHFGVEATMFSFNESDLGIDVHHTAQEHAELIKSMGKEMASRGLNTKMLLGDTSDANPTSFIIPALNDKDTHPYIGAISFHSWRGCDDATLKVWADAAKKLNVPLLVGEGSTDAAAWRYPQIFKESTFALYEINLYMRLCSICQPQSILQWQLTADYSLLWGGGIFGVKGDLVPTQRFWNLKQLASTPEGSFALPVTCEKTTLNCAAFANIACNKYCVHMVNNGAACATTIEGLPTQFKNAKLFYTNADDSMKESTVAVNNGKITLELPPVSFITVLLED